MRTPTKLTIRTAWTLFLLLPLLACEKQEAPARTMTNEQGCTRIRSIGPQDPYKDPPPLKQACLGPHLLDIPQHYFYNQIGTEHDGSYALALEYPSLEPFKPGERMNLTTDVAVRTITIDYRYIDRIDVREALRRSYIPMDYKKDEPQENLETRIAGDAINDLTPYFVDMDVVRAHFRSKGFKEGARIMSTDWHTDWFLHRDEEGEVKTIIKCTSREVTASGVEYENGKMVKSRGYGLAKCDHTFTIEPINTLVLIDYPREGIRHWKEIEQRARDLLVNFTVDERKNRTDHWP